VISGFLDENEDQFITTAGFDGKISLWNDEMHMVCTQSFVPEGTKKDNASFRVRALTC
jgi:hypothetical protein